MTMDERFLMPRVAYVENKCARKSSRHTRVVMHCMRSALCDTTSNRILEPTDVRFVGSTTSWGKVTARTLVQWKYDVSSMDGD